MFIQSVILIGLVTHTWGTQYTGLRVLFPLPQKQYTYDIKSNISCGTLVPTESDSHWTLDGKLLVQVYDNYSRLRLSLSIAKTAAFAKDHSSGLERGEAIKCLEYPWEVEFLEDGNINFLYVSQKEPLWATNIKRALSINFQLKKDVGTYYNWETCLYQTQKDCQVVYVSNGNVIRKYNALHILSENSGYSSWMSVPMDFSKAAFFGGPETHYNGPVDYNGPLDNIGTADRVYELDSEIGLMNLDLKSVFEHKSRSHILAVTTDLSLNYNNHAPLKEVVKLDLVKTNKRYAGHDYTDPTNGIRKYTQDELKDKTYEILTAASKGIDADNIVKNASLIHNLDFVNLLKTMSQLNYASLSKLYVDMMLGTSYEVETSRNIFLEVLPHVRTNACALFIKYLVTEQKHKIEEATLLSLIRKLPFNVANHSQELLEELEVFTRLGLDFSQDIRHAGILSFATLAYKADEVGRVKRDYFDNIVVKYFRMYVDCPQYIDKLVWLQGLSNLQNSIETYMWTIYNNERFNRHERFWAILATTPVFAPTGFAATWHILVNEEEHIQIRIAALHSFLSSKNRPSELLSVHNFIMESKNEQLKRFWYTTVKSLENSKNYNGYRVASNYIPFLTNQVRNQDPKFWATGNHIVGTYDDETATGAMLQLMTIGDPLSGLPALLHFRIKTVSELMATSDIGLFIKAEGVASNMFEKLHTMNSHELNMEDLIEVLKKMKVQTTTPQKVHIEIVLKVHEKTVYSTHLNQTRFDKWNGEDLSKSLADFLRFGSHINQQVVYYPFQLDANIPTELGTPVRLQTAIVSFSSIRGNLTANNFTWRNDVHLRYQGTAVTSLCTDGPLIQTEHCARVQQSVVAHQPLIFDVSIAPVTRSFELKWLNPALNSGLAMHAHAQVELDSPSSPGRIVHTVNSAVNDDSVDENGVFFDCDQRMTVAELLEKLMASNAVGYDFMSKLHPSVLILNGLLLLSAPPSGSCGLIVGGNKSGPTDRVFTLNIIVDELWLSPEDRFTAKLGYQLQYSDRPTSEVLFNVNGSIAFDSTGRNTSLHLELNGDYPKVQDLAMKTWKFCLNHQDSNHFQNLDITTNPSAYYGYVSASFARGHSDICPVDGSTLEAHYKGLPVENMGDGTERYFEVNVVGNKLPNLSALSENVLGPHPGVRQFFKDFVTDPLNLTAVFKETKGVTKLSVNGQPEVKVQSETFPMILYSWSLMQVMKKFGLYRECRLYESTVQTLTGTLDRLPPVECSESLALGDCTEKPRFAVLRTKSGGVKVFTGGNHVLVNRVKGSIVISINGDPVDCHNGCIYPEKSSISDFQISYIGDTVKVHSRLSGIQVFYKSDVTVILAPHFYMGVGCGSCMSQHYYKLC